MALIKCTRCGHMISDRAKACPKCGEPVRIINETPNETRPSGQSYSRPDSSINQAHKKKTRPAFITTIALLTLAVLSVGGFVFYKMVYEPSRLVDQSDHEVLIDMSDDYSVDRTVVMEEQTGIVQKEEPVAIEEPEVEPVEESSCEIKEKSNTSDVKAIKNNSKEVTNSGTTIQSTGIPKISGLVGYSLDSWAKPNPDSKWSGQVTVRVTVDPNGRVNKASVCSATGELASHSEVKKACEQAALGTSFIVPNNTSTEGIGTLTYKW